MAIAASLILTMTVHAQTPDQWKGMKGDVSLFLANDLGRNGYYDQKPIAALMGEMAETIGPEAVLALGDVHHFSGVASTADPLWMTNYELIYSHPELMMPWLPILGNHEYRGNTQAVMDYSKVSRRWMMEGRYYTQAFGDDEGRVSIRIVFVDTTPMINRYHNNPTYPDVDSQDVEAQLAWLDRTLCDAKEDWVIVVGHHPVYAQTGKDIIEQQDMQQRLLPILDKHSMKVAMYVCGHIHNFQHIRRGNDGIDFVVNSAGSLARKVKPTEGTVFCSPEPGFSVLTATKEQLCLSMVDKTGTVIHRIVRTQK
ncbi:MAG: metallophosphoesterase [Bacteroidaceae bacterium]